MSETEVEPGDVVALKSGGPPMTVVKLIPKSPEGPSAKCMWFQGEAPPHEREFVLAALTVLEDIDDLDDDLDDEE